MDYNTVSRARGSTTFKRSNQSWQIENLFLLPETRRDTRSMIRDPTTTSSRKQNVSINPHNPLYTLSHNPLIIVQTTVSFVRPTHKSSHHRRTDTNIVRPVRRPHLLLYYISSITIAKPDELITINNIDTKIDCSTISHRHHLHKGVSL